MLQLLKMTLSSLEKSPVFIPHGGVFKQTEKARERQTGEGGYLGDDVPLFGISLTLLSRIVQKAPRPLFRRRVSFGLGHGNTPIFADFQANFKHFTGFLTRKLAGKAIRRGKIESGRSQKEKK